MLRPIITIDEEKCNGCGKCITDCAEGALAIVNGKAKLISETYCDGLGACLNCPQDALKLEMQEALPFDEKAAMEALKQRASATNSKQCRQPEKHNAKSLNAILKPIIMSDKNPVMGNVKEEIPGKLQTWPLQLELMPAAASYLQNANIVLAAHCAGFAVPDIQEKYLKNKVPVIACPKLQDNAKLIEKLGNIIKTNDIISIEILRMSVPCCGGLEKIVQNALEYAKKNIPVMIKIINL